MGRGKARSAIRRRTSAATSRANTAVSASDGGRRTAAACSACVVVVGGAPGAGRTGTSATLNPASTAAPASTRRAVSCALVLRVSREARAAMTPLLTKVRLFLSVFLSWFSSVCVCCY